MNAREALHLLLAALAVASLGYFLVAAVFLRRWWRERPPASDAGVVDLPPVTFFRPLKADVPELSAKLTVLAEALRAGDQLLVGVEADSEEWAAAEALRMAFPERDVVVVACIPGDVSNPKIAKVLQMEPQARHEHWILSDSEAVTDATFLEVFRREWMHCDVLTAGYRFSGSITGPQQLDAVGVLLTLWPGLAVLRASGPLRTTLGACTGFRRRDLEGVGGWRAFAEELAEDNRLGRALAAAGRTIRLSSQVVTLQSDPLSWGDYWRHQRRVAVTYRIASPRGFAGAVFTQGATAALVLVALVPRCPWAWLLCAAVFLTRWLTARDAARILSFELPRLLPAVILASVVETLCWALSWTTRSVWWSGKRRRISWDGRLRASR